MTNRVPTVLTCAALVGIGVLGGIAATSSPKQSQAEIAQPQQPAPRFTWLARVTAYCPCEKCCGKFADGKTSTGTDAWRTRGVAVDPRIIPYGTKVHIKGVGTFIADDTGSAMRKSGKLKLDIRFPTHEEALKFGVQELEVEF